MVKPEIKKGNGRARGRGEVEENLVQRRRKGVM